MGIKEWLIPQDKVFFDLFDRLAAVVVLASYRMVDLVDDFSDIKAKVRQLEQLEHEGDKITHEIYEQLNRTFITPLDHEEISRLASALDDILDFIEGTAQRMYNYGISDADSHMVEMAKLIQLSVVELEEAEKFCKANPMIDAYFIYSGENGEFKTYYTDGMKRYMPDAK